MHSTIINPVQRRLYPCTRGFFLQISQEPLMGGAGSLCRRILIIGSVNTLMGPPTINPFRGGLYLVLSGIFFHFSNEED